MATDTLIMVVLICVGSALGLTGLGIAGYQAVKLLKSARATGDKSKAKAQQIAGRVERLAPRVRELERQQRAMAESIQNLSATAREFD